MTSDMKPRSSVLRELGTSYVGKEPHEYIVDIIRLLVRLAGDEFLFEGCLTTRPFTSRTYVRERPGSMLPGRGNAVGADRVRTDLADALAVLGQVGWHYEPVGLSPGLFDADDRQALVVGPLRAEDRWCPIPDRLLCAEAWRYVTMERWLDTGAICFDPLFGGYTCISAEQLTSDGVVAIQVTAPRRWPDVMAAAERCHLAGVASRARSASTDRDSAGLAKCADAAGELATGSSARRLRSSLQNQALQALRWSCLLGHLRTGDINVLALADVLREFLVTCRAAHNATAIHDADQLKCLLGRLAAWAEATDELSARLVGETS
jgi:hypothetical protein